MAKNDIYNLNNLIEDLEIESFKSESTNDYANNIEEQVVSDVSSLLVNESSRDLREKEKKEIAKQITQTKNKLKIFIRNSRKRRPVIVIDGSLIPLTDEEIIKVWAAANEDGW